MSERVADFELTTTAKLGGAYLRMSKSKRRHQDRAQETMRRKLADDLSLPEGLKQGFSQTFWGRGGRAITSGGHTPDAGMRYQESDRSE